MRRGFTSRPLASPGPRLGRRRDHLARYRRRCRRQFHPSLKRQPSYRAAPRVCLIRLKKPSASSSLLSPVLRTSGWAGQNAPVIEQVTRLLDPHDVLSGKTSGRIPPARLCAMTRHVRICWARRAEGLRWLHRGLLGSPHELGLGPAALPRSLGVGVSTRASSGMPPRVGGAGGRFESWTPPS